MTKRTRSKELRNRAPNTSLHEACFLRKPHDPSSGARLHPDTAHMANDTGLLIHFKENSKHKHHNSQRPSDGSKDHDAPTRTTT